MRLLFEVSLRVTAMAVTAAGTLLVIYWSRRLNVPSFSERFGIETWLGLDPSSLLAGLVGLSVLGGVVTVGVAKTDDSRAEAVDPPTIVPFPVGWLMGVSGFAVALGTMRTVGFAFLPLPLAVGAVAGGLFRLGHAVLVETVPENARRGLLVVGAVGGALYALERTSVGFSALVGAATAYLAVGLVDHLFRE